MPTIQSESSLYAGGSRWRAANVRAPGLVEAAIRLALQTPAQWLRRHEQSGAGVGRVRVPWIRSGGHGVVHPICLQRHAINLIMSPLMLLECMNQDEK